jgi:hypothetical protein
MWMWHYHVNIQVLFHLLCHTNRPKNLGHVVERYILSGSFILHHHIKNKNPIVASVRVYYQWLLDPLINLGTVPTSSCTRLVARGKTDINYHEQPSAVYICASNISQARPFFEPPTPALIINTQT